MEKKKNIVELPETQIIVLAKKDSNYFGVLYDRYFEQIFRFVFRRLGGKEDEAGDLTQQTFIKAMANLDRYEERGLPFSSWLYRIAQNEVSMFFRKQKKQRTVAVDENRIHDLATEANLGSYMTTEDQEKLIDVLNDLKSDHLEIIELRFFQSMSFKEIAEIYNITEANAKMRTYRILERIAKTWK